MDLSKLELTHHKLTNKGRQNLLLGGGDVVQLPPMTDPGSGEVHDPDRALLAEIIARVNELFEGDLTDGNRNVTYAV